MVAVRETEDDKESFLTFRNVRHLRGNFETYLQELLILSK